MSHPADGWGLGKYLLVAEVSYFLYVSHCVMIIKKTSQTFIIKGFRTIVFIFLVISTMFRTICPPPFFRCLSNSGTFTELRTTSFIESTGATCSDSVSHNRVQVLSIPVLLIACSQDWTCNLQKLRELTPITITPCVLLDNSEWIF